MFTVYGIYPDPPGHEDGEVECATLDEALLHLRELIENEMADPDGPIFSRYAIHFDRSIAQEAPPPTQKGLAASEFLRLAQER